MAEQLAETKFNQKMLDWARFQQQEETKFNERLRQKEAAKMRELEDEYRQKDQERSMKLESTRAEYSKQEAKLRKALSDLDERERRLGAAQEELKQKHAQRLSELQLLQRRLREDSKHQVRRDHARRFPSKKGGPENHGCAL